MVGKVVGHAIGGVFAMELGEHGFKVIERHGEETEVVLACKGLCVQRDEVFEGTEKGEPVVHLGAGVVGRVDGFGSEDLEDMGGAPLVLGGVDPFEVIE